MTKKEFLQTLDSALYFLSDNERREILADYEEYFSNEMSAGKNEYQIASDLGNPIDISEQYKPQAADKTQQNTSQTQSQNINFNQNINISSIPENKPQPQQQSAQSPQYNNVSHIKNPRLDDINPTYQGAAYNDDHYNNESANIQPQQNNNTQAQADNEINSDEAQKKNNRKYHIHILLSILYGCAIVALTVTLFGLMVAGFASVAGVAIASIVTAFAGFFLFANVGLMFGCFLLGIGLTLLMVFVFKLLLLAPKALIALTKSLYGKHQQYYNGGAIK